MRFRFLKRSSAILLISLSALLLISNNGLAKEEPGSKLYLGVYATEIPFEVLKQHGLEYGVKILRVLPDSPAKEAGLQKGDILLSLNNHPIYSVARLRWLIRQAPKDTTSTLEIYRDGERLTVTVRLRAQAPRRIQIFRQFYRPHSYLGVQLQNMTPELRKYFGAPENAGMLITEVEEDSPAQKAGLQAGDVILKMADKTIRSLSDVHRVLNFFDPGEKIKIEILREKKKQTVQVILGDPPERPDVSIIDPEEIEEMILEIPHQFQEGWEELQQRFQEWRDRGNKYWIKEEETEDSTYLL